MESDLPRDHRDDSRRTCNDILPPDLAPKTCLGSILFLVCYTVFLLGLERTAPGYSNECGIYQNFLASNIAGLPIEELLFAAAFGAYWSSVYEHFTWRRLAPRTKGEASRDKVKRTPRGLA